MVRLRTSRWLPFLCACAFVLAFATVASACPNCKDALAANDPEQNGVVRGYFYSILFMMGMPFAMVSFFSVYMYRQVLRARAERDAKKREFVGQGPAL